MKQRLQKILSAAGICSRRTAEKYIDEGRVRVNGVPASLGDSADPETDEITLNGKIIRVKEEKTYILLNKPTGFVTTLSDEKGRRTVGDLVSDLNVRVYPVGRLDLNSDGLLIMTDDGELSNALMHPSHGVGKLYRVEAEGKWNDDIASHLEGPMELDGEVLQKAEISFLKETASTVVFEIRIYEGKNRQVRRMCDKVGLRVIRLTRLSEGGIFLGDLPSGKWRRLSENEIITLKKNAGI